MNMLGICAVLYFTIVFVVDLCDAECDEYIIVFEENTCPMYRLTPLTLPKINWDEVVYPCNSTLENPEKKKCVLEFVYNSTTASCDDIVKVKNYQSHSLIAGNNTTEHDINKTKALDVPKSNITEIKKPQSTVDLEVNTSYNVNLIYIHENDNTSSGIINNKSKIICVHAETVCINEDKPENYSLSDVTHNELAGTLQIKIDRDRTSLVQPIFTGYFPQSLDSISFDFKDLKTVNLTCPTLKDKICKRNIGNKSIKHLNIYIKTIYIQNNTITNYPNCIKGSITTKNSLNVKCEDTLFAEHNKHILLIHPTPPPKQELRTWKCQIAELNMLFSKEQHSENSNILHFKNCSNDTNRINNKNKSGDKTLILEINNTAINNITKEINKIENSTGKEKNNKDDITKNKAEITGERIDINKDNLTKINPDKIITIHVTEKGNNCSHNSLNIHKGKIIDLSSNKEKVLENNILELNLSNCLNGNSSKINNTPLHQVAKLIIILKNESLNTTLKLFNGTTKEANLKQRILLRCEFPNRDSSENTTNNKTILQCESIDLDFYNITGIEISTNLSQVSNTNNTKEQEIVNVNKIEENHNQTKINAEINRNNNCSANKTAKSNEFTANDKSNENDKKVIENKEVQNKDSESLENFVNLNLNRKKDIANGTGQNNLALGNTEKEKILLITLLTVASISILTVFALKILCPTKRKYSMAPTREPPDDEETAF